MLSRTNLHHGFWEEGLKTAVHVCIKSPHVSLKGSIPEDFWFGKLASYDHLRIFGCDAFVHIRPELDKQVRCKVHERNLMGYGDEGEMGYRIWLPPLQKVIHSRDVV